ncbi:uncharacterized protein EDB93DRAFT_1084775 [Suillus bovinus]|uniref:uncharacterized protein n=1 Tax=Suillus bovinus TaxID=48563 RepID=UPI001B872AC0|nr:uncharacterized protein EDB93DRAFT_1084775 [Suillus bovinus]KAG2148702.1 hypothetical protein EDB93DRAFT_1084775 [Suillus bovinus]
MSNTSRLCNVETVQIWRLGKEPQRPYSLHWALYVETSPGIGNTYQIMGTSDNYAIDIRRNRPLENDWSKRIIMGTVTLEEIDEMERILTTVDIMHNVPNWNGNDWFMSALVSLSRSELTGMMPKARLAWERYCGGICGWQMCMCSDHPPRAR